MKPTYFDFTVKDLGEARAFFESVFGWRFERFPMPYEYYRIEAGDPNEPGIDGGVGATKDTEISGGNPLTQVTIPVPDLDDFISKVHAAGGLVIEPKMPIPGIGWYATCAEPGGVEVWNDPGRSKCQIGPSRILWPGTSKASETSAAGQTR